MCHLVNLVIQTRSPSPDCVGSSLPEGAFICLSLPPGVRWILRSKRRKEHANVPFGKFSDTNALSLTRLCRELPPGGSLYLPSASCIAFAAVLPAPIAEITVAAPVTASPPA